MSQLLLLFKLSIHSFGKERRIVDVYKYLESNVLYVLTKDENLIDRMNNTLIEFEIQSIDTEPVGKCIALNFVYMQDTYNPYQDFDIIEFSLRINRNEKHNVIQRNINNIQKLIPRFKLRGLYHPQ